MKTVTILEAGDEPKKGDLGFWEARGIWVTAEERFDEQNPKSGCHEDARLRRRRSIRKEWGCASPGVYNGTVVFIRP